MFDDFEAALRDQRKKSRRLCGLSRWLENLDPEDRARADAILSDETYNSRQLTRYLNTKGAGLDAQVVHRHRSRICCGQATG